MSVHFDLISLECLKSLLHQFLCISICFRGRPTMSPALICPCSSRSPWRRKKNCLLVAIPVMAIIAFMQMIEVDEVYSPLHPLSDAKSEAKRLLNIMTHYNYQCNMSLQVGNASIWPICMDKVVALNLDEQHKNILYTIGFVLAADSCFVWSWDKTVFCSQNRLDCVDCIM